MIVFYTYILKLNNSTYYTGITNNIARRLLEHKNGYSKSTKWHLPVTLIYLKDFSTRQASRRLEVKIKNFGAKRYLNKLKFSINNLPISSPHSQN